MPQSIRIRGAALCAVAALAFPAAAAAAPPRSAPTLPPVTPGPLSPVMPQPESAPARTATGSARPAAAVPPGAISVTDWGFSQSPPRGAAAPTPTPMPVPSGPLYVWLTLNGGAAAVGRLQGGTPPVIQVHWTNATPAAGAPDAVTSLTVGRPELAPLLAGEVRRTGHFVWHSWARKDTLSPGRWIVSLTDASGQPLPCGTTDPHPCQISLEVGAG